MLRRSSGKGPLALLLTMVMVLGTMAFAAPARAQDPDEVQLFQPDEAFADGSKSVVADQFDGDDNTAHITAVADVDADSAHFYRCDDENASVNDFDTADCHEIGHDTSGRQPEDGTTDEAYEIFYPVVDDGGGSVIVLACDGTAEPSGATVPGDCVADVTNEVTFDDASDNGADYSTGEIQGVCAEDVPGNDCDDTNDDDFDSLPHGGETPDDEFNVLAFTSDDVDDAEMCVDLDADADTDPSGCDVDGTLVDQSDEGLYRAWVFEFDSSALDEGDEGDLVLYCTTCNKPFAGPGLVLDEHFFAVDDESFDDPDDDDDSDVPVDAAITFIGEEAGADCEDPDVDATNDGDNVDPVDVEGCLFDNDDNRETGEETTFELSGIGEFTVCEDGTLHDHNADTLNEHCHFSSSDSADNGSYDATIANVTASGAATSGNAVVTFCRDTEATGSDAGTVPAPTSGHGCDDESSSLTASATKRYLADGDVDDDDDAVDVSLAFDEGNGDCFGPSTLTNQVGDSDTLVICTRNADGDLVGTEGRADTSLSWTNSAPGVVSLETQPDATEGGGLTDTVLTALSEGVATITVTLTFNDEASDPGRDDDSSPEVDTATITKTVTDPGRTITHRSFVSIDYSRRPRPPAFRGNVGSAAPCELNRRVALFRVRPGRDRRVGRAFTDTFGNWRIVKFRPRGRFYAVARRKVIRDGNLTTICLRDRSITIPVRRRRR